MALGDKVPLITMMIKAKIYGVRPTGELLRRNGKML
jgi:hypothetical protein